MKMYGMDIELLKDLQPNDIIIMQYDINTMPIDEVHTYYEMLVQAIPHHPVLAFPKDTEILALCWDKANDFIQSLKPKGETINDR